jgi:hypothetical protein
MKYEIHNRFHSYSFEFVCEKCDVHVQDIKNT